MLNKSDLPPVTTASDISEAFGVSPVVMSAANSTGLSQLKEAVFKACAFDIAATESVMINNARQHEAASAALNSICDAKTAIELGLESELIATDLKDAWHLLGLITGRTLDEDIVDRIFESFCLGK